ncbi:30S ribosomal protein S4 [Candidatus Woesearchaeota archaeon CG10_big_fil_rev_8_21_14_0_10_34_8]|nr:MAG: 30S ribosomal protein S4 [Candidatus Woesearchaeota archaeon CG10_big_fil_rev_8_21_14_0_10_34_8]
MGQPKKTRKKYSTPRHPWQKARIDEEKGIVKEYGVRNKKEIWKMAALLRSFTSQAKKLVVATSEQGLREKQNLLKKLQRYGLIQADATTDQILSLKLKDVMDRRLQTLVWKKGLANTVKQSRQFITHKHVMVGGKKVSSPSYMVSLEEEGTISISPGSSIASLKEEETPKKMPAKEEPKQKEVQSEEKKSE